MVQDEKADERCLQWFDSDKLLLQNNADDLIQ
jgi:hypothetical protein